MPRVRPALLLDRDGVINIEKDYVYQISDFEFVDGIFELCHQAADAGMAIVVVTNQAGIGRGYYTENGAWFKMGDTFSGGHRLSHGQIIQNSHCQCYPKTLLLNHAGLALVTPELPGWHWVSITPQTALVTLGDCSR